MSSLFLAYWMFYMGLQLMFQLRGTSDTFETACEYLYTGLLYTGDCRHIYGRMTTSLLVLYYYCCCYCYYILLLLFIIIIIIIIIIKLN